MFADKAAMGVLRPGRVSAESSDLLPGIHNASAEKKIKRYCGKISHKFGRCVTLVTQHCVFEG
ncbi:hypothetical protein [Microbulbifer sp. VAAF005]|uniref:hypothetical protein n=1 Tax=Microbulbifer sp. VAAF005 TaxID=3034230 RepID=UPI0024AD10D4|nr:hypothetical protein [Microbulbifer sp. VAAF005]WHI47821.1 hypothetical protein P0078_05345 [Microbulbifer sp. VAAF005]